MWWTLRVGRLASASTWVDGISLCWSCSTFLMPIVFLSAFSAITERSAVHHRALVLETGMLPGTFFAMDLFVFYVFWR